MSAPSNSFNIAITAGGHGVDLPEAVPSTTFPSVPGSTIAVNSGDDLQAAINSASLGDEIVLEAGATWTGPYTLPDKGAGTDWITIRSANLSSLPEGARVGPSDAANMPKIEAGNSTNQFAIDADANAHHYRFAGIEVAQNTGVGTYNLIDQQYSNHHFTWDRCYIHADSAQTAYCVRAGNFAGQYVAVIDSYLADFHFIDSDAQAFWAATGHYFLVHNNFLSATGECLLFGGTPGWTEDQLASDITITKNDFFWPLAWQRGGTEWDGKARLMKNHLELKVGRRVLIEANTFQNWWMGDAGQGFPVVFKGTNQSGRDTPFSIVEHVTYRYNYMQGTGSGIQIAEEGGSQGTRNVLIEHNLIVDMALTQEWNQPGYRPRTTYGFFLLHAHPNVTIRHNTVCMYSLDAARGLYLDSLPSTNFKFNDNIVGQGQYGWGGRGMNFQTVQRTLISDGEVKNNVVYEGPMTAAFLNDEAPSENNVTPATLVAVDFENYIEAGGGDYSLAASSPYKGTASDGSDPGVNFSLYSAARA